MGIVDIWWYSYRLPFRGSFGTAHGAMAVREGAIVELCTEGRVIGVGEIAPLPEFGGGTLADALAALAALAPRLCGKTLVEALACVWSEFEAGSIPASGACGLEIALLDALGKQWGCSVGELLCVGPDLPGLQADKSAVPTINRGLHGVVGGVVRWGDQAEPQVDKSADAINLVPTGGGIFSKRALSGLGEKNGDGDFGDAGEDTLNRSLRVSVNAVIGVADTINRSVQGGREAVAMGFGCVKLKMGRGSSQEECERVAAVREAMGSAIHLRLDANEGWDFEQARTILRGCAQYDIQYVEQPLSARDLAGMRRLRQEVSIPIAADEALYDLASARLILAEEAADILIVKPQLVGGLRVGRLIIEEAARCGVECVVTSALEAGIGLAGVLQLVAASPEVTLECGLATLPLLEDDLLDDELAVRDGFLAVPGGPGLGVRLDREALKKYAWSSVYTRKV